MTNKPEEKVELMRKSRFESIKDKFTKIEGAAATAIEAAKDEDILALTLSIDNPVIVTEAIVRTPDQLLQEAFCG